MKLSKTGVLIETVKYVYRSSRIQVIVRELTLILQVAVEIWGIYVWGVFLDATADYITSVTAFNLTEYFYSDSFYYLALGTGLTLLTIAFSRLRQYLEEYIYYYLLFDFQTDFFNKISRANLQEVESGEFRNLMALTETYAFQHMWHTYRTFMELVKQLVTGVSAIAILIYDVNLYALLLILIALPEPIIGYYNRNKLRNFNEKEIEKTKWISYIENLMTRIQHFMEMKVDSTFKAIKQEYSDKCEYIRDNTVEIIKHHHIDTTLFAVLGRIGVIIFVIFSFTIAIAKSLTIGNIKVIFDYASRAYESFSFIFETIFQIRNRLDYIHNFFEFLNYQGFGELSTGDRKLKKGTPSLEFKDIDFTYPSDENLAVHDMNFRIEPGENVMIIGDDGSGKSTLAKLLCGLYKIEAGDYEVDGLSIRQLKRGELKKKITGVFQDYVNYNMTLKKNITLSSEKVKVNEELFNKALKIAGLDKLMKKYNISPNQQLGKYISNGRDVSPGFWQRIAIARMIYRNRQIFILDEPFTYIDDAEEYRILKELFDFIGKDRTVIYITRDNRHTEFFDKIYYLKEGKLIKK